MKRDNIPLKEKYALTVTEASRYYNIGPRRLRLMADQHLGDFAVFSGNKYLILREKFEEFLKQTSSIQKNCLSAKQQLTFPGFRVSNAIPRTGAGKAREDDQMRPALEEKNLLNPGETIKLFRLSQRKFYELINGKRKLPFLVLYNKRKLDHPDRV